MTEHGLQWPTSFIFGALLKSKKHQKKQNTINYFTSSDPHHGKPWGYFTTYCLAFFLPSYLSFTMLCLLACKCCTAEPKQPDGYQDKLPTSKSFCCIIESVPEERCFRLSLLVMSAMHPQTMHPPVQHVWILHTSTLHACHHFASGNPLPICLTRPYISDILSYMCVYIYI